MRGKSPIIALPNGSRGEWYSNTEQNKDTSRKIVGTDMGYTDLAGSSGKPYLANS